MGVTSVPVLRVCPVTVLGRDTHRNAKEGRGQLRPQRTCGASQVCLFFWAKLLIIIVSSKMLNFCCIPMASFTMWLRLWQTSMQEFFCDVRSFYLETKHIASCTVVIFSALGEYVLMRTCEVLIWNCEDVKPGAAGEDCELPMGRWVCHTPMCGDRKCRVCYFTSASCGPMQQPAISSHPSC